MKYKMQLELTIETESDMEKLTEIIHGIVWYLKEPSRREPVRPDFSSVEVEQLTVKRLAKEPEDEG